MQALVLGGSYLLIICFWLSAAAIISVAMLAVWRRRGVLGKRVVLLVLATFIVSLGVFPIALSLGMKLWQGACNQYEPRELVGQWEATYLLKEGGRFNAREIIDLRQDGTFDQRIIAGDTQLIVEDQAWYMIDGKTILLEAAKCIPCCWYYAERDEGIRCLEQQSLNEVLLTVWMERLPQQLTLEHGPIGDPDGPALIRLYRKQYSTP